MGMKHKQLGKYIVYSDGRVFSISAGSFLIPNIDQQGYASVKVPHRIKLHRLVASCFKENKMGYPVINHKNGIKTDNRIENLEWCTQKHNMIHAFGSGLCKNQIKGQSHPWSKLTDIQVHVIKEAMDNGHKGYRVAKYFNVHRATVYKIRDGISWGHLATT